MINRKSILAIIPARIDSKGIPQKNIKKLAGKPLIAWTIKEAKKSKYIDRLIITTDSEVIARISRKEGAETPFLRPFELALDNSSGTDVIQHTLEWFQKDKSSFDYFIYLQPTSPFRTVKHIDEAIESIMSSKQSNSLISVSIPSKHPYWMKKINKDGFLESFIETDKSYNNRQELPNVFAVNGAIYICKWNVFLKDHSFYKGNCLPFIMDSHSSIDLDTLDDWSFAEYLLNQSQAL